MTLCVIRNMVSVENTALSMQLLILSKKIKIQCNMDKGKHTCGIFIHLKKAFHTVSHDILLCTPSLWCQRYFS